MHLRINSANVIHETIDGEVLLIHLKSGRHYSVGGAGAEIWGHIVSGTDIGTIFHRIARGYHGPQESIEKGINHLLNDFLKEDLVVLVDETGRGSDRVGDSLRTGLETERACFEAPLLQRYCDTQDSLWLDRNRHLDAEAMLSRMHQSEPSIQRQHQNPFMLFFFEIALKIFRRATEASDLLLERFYSIGGHVVCLRFAGRALELQVTRALEHLEVNPTRTPSLTVCIWDDISTNTRMPIPPWLSPAVYTRRGDLRGYEDDRISAAYNWGADGFTLFDKHLGLAICWMRDARRLPDYETSAPLRTILHWWVNQSGRQLVHAGAVGTVSGGVLLAGKGGSGKSTVALSCLNSDLVYVSDDYCLITVAPTPYVYSLYSSAKLLPENLHRVPHVIPALSNPDRLEKEKAVFFLHSHFSGKITHGFPLRAILLPRIAGTRDTILKPASSMDALSALALSTISQLAGAGKYSLQIMSHLVDSVPCYHLELGTDLRQVPPLIENLVDTDYRSAHKK